MSTNCGDVTEGSSSVQKGNFLSRVQTGVSTPNPWLPADMQGIVLSFETAAYGKSFNMRPKRPHGELGQK